MRSLRSSQKPSWANLYLKRLLHRKGGIKVKKELVSFISDILVCVCLGIIIDALAKTSFIFTVIGLAVGIILAIILKNKNRKEK